MQRFKASKAWKQIENPLTYQKTNPAASFEMTLQFQSSVIHAI